MSKAVANLTQLNETITFSAQDNGETINVKINELARGPAGADGPNSVTSATTSDGTANLSLSNVTTATATVTGTLTADHIHGNLAGSVYAHVRAGETLAKGDPVYVSGSHGTGANLIAIVSKADASDPLKMPAVGVMDAAVTANASGHMVITGTISDINTAAYSVNAELYVAEGGGFTATPPSAYAQPVAQVERSNTNNGAVIVKVNGLSASDATANTLVRRSSTGGASFGSLTLTSALALSSGGTGGTTAGTARTNLGLGTADTPTFSNLTLNTGTITVPQPLSFSQTWNSTATFTALQMNITDSGPANAASLLMDLRVGGISQCRVRKDGLLTCNFVTATGGGSNFASITSSSTGIFSQSGGRIGISSTGYIGFASSSDATSASDTIILRDAANTLAQRNGTNAQESRVYGTYTSATNFERLNLKYNGTATAFQIGTEKGSAGGTARPLEFQTDGTTRMTIGADGQSSLTQTWNAAGTTFKALDVNVTDTASASGSLLMDLRVGGVSKLSMSKGSLLKAGLSWSLEQTSGSLGIGGPSGGNGFFFYSQGGSSSTNSYFNLSSSGATLPVSRAYGWSSTADVAVSQDLSLFRDAANTLAQRNGTNAQVTRVYDTYTSATDYHRLAIATARATATAMSGATVTLTNIIPAGAVVVGVTCKVTTAITGATSFDIGTATDVDRFGAAIAVALGTTSDNRNWTAGTIECFPTATSLILTANGSNFTAGAVYVSVQYLSGQAD